MRLHLSALKSFYGYLDDRGVLEGRNPVERIKAPRVRRRPNDRLRPDEDKALLEACATEQEKVLTWLLRWTGLRVGGALALAVEDVDLERRVVRVRASKTDAGLRTVPIVDEPRATQFEPATLGLKVPQIRHILNGKTPFQRFWEAVSGRGAEPHLTTFTLLEAPPRPRSLPTLAYLVGCERSDWCVGGVFTRRS